MNNITKYKDIIAFLAAFIVEPKITKEYEKD